MTWLKWNRVIFLAFLVQATYSSAIKDSKVVTTKIGQVEGVEVTGNTGKKAIAFLGIPYAEPPIGDLRFRRPIPVQEPFKEVFKANKEPLPCYQYTRARKQGRVKDGNELGPDLYLEILRKHDYFYKRPFTEDCLKLNIYVPEDCPPKASVLVYIHGGFFYVGSSISRHKPETLASDQKVIVVTLNYRLGVLGFLSLGHEEAPGNAGLMDQQLALEFVHDNIEAFGGNPEDVTLAGTDAGAASVGFQMYSPRSKGLFKKAIMQGGNPFDPPFYAKRELVIEKSNEIATKMGYKGEKDPVKVAEYLRSLHPEDLHDGYAALCPKKHQNMIVPTIDGHFLTKHPIQGLKDVAESQKLTLLIGTTSNEGDIFAYAMNPELIFGKKEEIDIYTFQRMLHNFGFGYEDAHNAVKRLDKERINDPAYIRKMAGQAVSEHLFTCDIIKFQTKLANHGSTVYRYIYDSKITFPFYGKIAVSMAPHGLDAKILSGTYLRPDNGTQDNSVERRTIQRFGNFIKHGHPTLDGKEDGFPVFTSTDRKILLIGKDKDEIVKQEVLECESFDEETLLKPTTTSTL